MIDPAIVAAFEEAITAAEATIGATAPNPSVGCAALTASGEMLAFAAHAGAGTPHAEALVIERCRAAGTLADARSLVVTLEPCNHHGRTPPCTRAIIAAGVSEVWVGAGDPNRRVAGGGIAALLAAGLRVRMLDGIDDPAARALATRCRKLIEPFAKWIGAGRPWVIVKRALDPHRSMIPPPGRKTFASDASLAFAHRLRRQADGILTGIGTILADAPEFTVRRVEDHPGKRRQLLILDRRRRTPAEYLDAAAARGFDVDLLDDPAEAIDLAGRLGALTLLVEAGPTLTGAMLNSVLWDECVTITASGNLAVPDTILTERRSGA